MQRLGDKANHWKGGIMRYSTGYLGQYQPQHHFSSKNGYVLQHRLVWEQSHNAMLLPWANVHHINKIKGDNRPENLEGMMKAEHTYRHVKKDFTGRFCFQCHQKTYIKHSYEDWYKHPSIIDEWLCRNCYRKLRWSLGLKR